jgi:hypothetical protein
MTDRIRARVAGLEDEVDGLERERDQLRAEVARLKSKNTLLRADRNRYRQALVDLSQGWVGDYREKARRALAGAPVVNITERRRGA